MNPLIVCYSNKTLKFDHEDRQIADSTSVELAEPFIISSVPLRIWMPNDQVGSTNYMPLKITTKYDQEVRKGNCRASRILNFESATPILKPNYQVGPIDK